MGTVLGMKLSSTWVRYLLTGLAVLLTTAVAGLVTQNLFVAATVAVIWAGYLASKEYSGSAKRNQRAEDESVRY